MINGEGVTISVKNLTNTFIDITGLNITLDGKYITTIHIKNCYLDNKDYPYNQDTYTLYPSVLLKIKFKYTHSPYLLYNPDMKIKINIVTYNKISEIIKTKFQNAFQKILKNNLNIFGLSIGINKNQIKPFKVYSNTLIVVEKDKKIKRYITLSQIVKNVLYDKKNKEIILITHDTKFILLKNGIFFHNKDLYNFIKTVKIPYNSPQYDDENYSMFEFNATNISLSYILEL